LLASVTQVQTAFRCACVLRDLISPYLLRRIKADVAHDLPKKDEQVLFSRLTPYQRQLYRDFLRSDSVSQVEKKIFIFFFSKIITCFPLFFADPGWAASRALWH